MGLGGLKRTERTVIVAIAALRVAQLAPYLLVISINGTAVYASPTAAVAIYAASAGWSTYVLWRGLRRVGLRQYEVYIDVAVMAIGSAVIGRLTETGATSWSNWTVGSVMGAAVVAGAYLSWPRMLGAASVLSGAYAWGVAGAWPDREVLVSGVGNAFSTLAFGIVTKVVVTHMRTAALSVEALAKSVQGAVRRETAEAARLAERANQHRLLHDTVLATLSALARGASPVDAPGLRERAQADVAFLRSMIATEASSPDTPLAARLATLARMMSSETLVVQCQVGTLLENVEPDIATALELAAREALNNVAQHSGAQRAWITAAGVGGEIIVRIVDQGVGFSMEVARSRGTGLGQSVIGRLAAVGGVALVESVPGEGTVVELRWPAP